MGCSRVRSCRTCQAFATTSQCGRLWARLRAIKGGQVGVCRTVRSGGGVGGGGGGGGACNSIGRESEHSDTLMTSCRVSCEGPNGRQCKFAEARQAVHLPPFAP